MANVDRLKMAPTAIFNIATLTKKEAESFPAWLQEMRAIVVSAIEMQREDAPEWLYKQRVYRTVPIESWRERDGKRHISRVSDRRWGVPRNWSPAIAWDLSQQTEPEESAGNLWGNEEREEQGCAGWQVSEYGGS